LLTKPMVQIDVGLEGIGGRIRRQKRVAPQFSSRGGVKMLAMVGDPLARIFPICWRSWVFHWAAVRDSGG